MPDQANVIRPKQKSNNQDCCCQNGEEKTYHALFAVYRPVNLKHATPKAQKSQK